MLFSLQSLTAQQQGTYYFNKTVKGTFEEVTDKEKSALKDQGFGVITEIDMDNNIKEKISDVEMSRLPPIFL